MSMPQKVTVFVVLAFLISGVLSFGTQKYFIMPSFIKLEKDTAIKNAERVIEAINRELSQISPSVSDWAYWTDTYEYTKQQNPDYAKEYFNADTAISLGMNFMGIYDTDGKALWTQGIDLETEEIVNAGQLSGKNLPEGYPLIQLKELTDEVRGIVATPHAPLLVVAKPILTNDRQGPITGTFMLGRFLDAAAIKRISRLTRLPITVLSSKQLPASFQIMSTHHKNLELLHSDFRQVETPDSWQIQTTLSDIDNKPIITLQIDTPREISAQGTAAVNQSLWALALTGLFVMLMLWKLLQNEVLGPISKLTKHALHIGENDNLATRLNLQRKDEIGVLAGTFDQMMDNLSDTRRRLIDQSYHSGMAEMASGVLHNIGNAVTPLNTRLSILQQELRQAPLAEMEQAAAELADPATSPDRRADLIQFVELVSSEMIHLLKGSKDKIDKSVQQVVEIQEILADQQRFSRSERVIEPVDIFEVINTVTAGLNPEFKNSIQINVSQSVAETGFVSGTRATVQQIVTNIILNAAESILSTKEASGIINITADQEESQGQPMAHLCFADNGAGIESDQLERLFERGYSTKNRAGSGYGLHWSANTANAIGGKMFAKSQGLGHGASIHLFLPSAQMLTQKENATVGKQSEF